MTKLSVFISLLSITTTYSFHSFAPSYSSHRLEPSQHALQSNRLDRSVCKDFQKQFHLGHSRLHQSRRTHEIKCGLKDSSDQFAALALPLNPDPALSPENVMVCLMRGLRWNDIPKQNTGLERCYNFADSMCRAAVGGHSSGAAGVSLDKFIAYAQNPVFSKMVNCAGFETEPINVLPGSETRGALATQVS
jgi:hypothetical protein